MLALSSLLGNSQRLDGGAMFGNAPRALWSRWAPPDELGRIELACRAFLVEDGSRRVLMETGIGVFFAPELRERYGVIEERHVLLESLHARGLDDADIDVVVLSHLHFDHAGGLLAAHEPGKPPRLLFPRARYVVGKTAFERARAPHPRDRASFIPELSALLTESGRLTLVERPEDVRSSLGEAFTAIETFGHTPGMLHVRVRGARGSALFAADLIPGTPWVHAPITMGYDRYPELLVDEKTRVLEQAANEGTILLFMHDAKWAAAGIERDPRGRFVPKAPVETLSSWDLDSAPAPSASSHALA